MLVALVALIVAVLLFGAAAVRGLIRNVTITTICFVLCAIPAIYLGDLISSDWGLLAVLGGVLALSLTTFAIINQLADREQRRRDAELKAITDATRPRGFQALRFAEEEIQGKLRE